MWGQDHGDKALSGYFLVPSVSYDVQLSHKEVPTGCVLILADSFRVARGQNLSLRFEYSQV